MLIKKTLLQQSESEKKAIWGAKTACALKGGSNNLVNIKLHEVSYFAGSQASFHPWNNFGRS